MKKASISTINGNTKNLKVGLLFVSLQDYAKTTWKIFTELWLKNNTLNWGRFTLHSKMKALAFMNLLWKSLVYE